MMTLKERIDVMAALGAQLKAGDDFLEATIKRTSIHNKWFTEANQLAAIQAISDEFLQKDKLTNWTSQYNLEGPLVQKVIGLVVAGNIPMVGFHDLLSVFMAGHRAQVKLSEKDPYVLPYLFKMLSRIDERAGAYFEVVTQLKGFDGVIATGSNNSARYFHQYFGKYPHIIRRNRNGIAILTGAESDGELKALGNDIFQYFGLGCRNVSKVYFPKDYELGRFLEAMNDFKSVILNEKYKNNYDYNLALFALSKFAFLTNDHLMLLENKDIPSRISSLHFEYYEDLTALEEELKERESEIQCVVAPQGALGLETIPFGKAQSPGLTDYADGVDTMSFLSGLSQVIEV